MNALYEAWGRNGPPAYLSLAIKAGFKPKVGEERIEMTADDFESFMQGIAPTGVG